MHGTGVTYGWRRFLAVWGRRTCRRVPQLLQLDDLDPPGYRLAPPHAAP
jgi:hypothetical protein